MEVNSEVRTLTTGVFFGQSCAGVTTASFQFSELQATIPEREVPRHTHDAPHFILVTEGVYLTEARNRRGLCLPGTLIFNPAGTTHRDCFRSQQGKFLSISPVTDASRVLNQAAPASLVISECGFSMMDDPTIGNRIIREVRNGIDRSAGLLEGLGFELLAAVARGERRRSRFIPGWLVRAKEMVEDCFPQELTVSELAGAARVHPVYLARAYRRHFGCSPGEHLRQRRLQRAERLLSRTDIPLVQVALQCGFSDQSQMTRFFTSNFGVPPGRYRRLHRA